MDLYDRIVVNYDEGKICSQTSAGIGRCETCIGWDDHASTTGKCITLHSGVATMPLADDVRIAPAGSRLAATALLRFEPGLPASAMADLPDRDTDKNARGGGAGGGGGGGEGSEEFKRAEYSCMRIDDAGLAVEGASDQSHSGALSLLCEATRPAGRQQRFACASKLSEITSEATRRDQEPSISPCETLAWQIESMKSLAREHGCAQTFVELQNKMGIFESACAQEHTQSNSD